VQLARLAMGPQRDGRTSRGMDRLCTAHGQGGLLRGRSIDLAERTSSLSGGSECGLPRERICALAELSG
jgi:hypothetical protein